MFSVGAFWCVLLHYSTVLFHYHWQVSFQFYISQHNLKNFNSCNGNEKKKKKNEISIVVTTMEKRKMKAEIKHNKERINNGGEKTEKGK